MFTCVFFKSSATELASSGVSSGIHGGRRACSVVAQTMCLSVAAVTCNRLAPTSQNHPHGNTSATGVSMFLLSKTIAAMVRVDGRPQPKLLGGAWTEGEKGEEVAVVPSLQRSDGDPGRKATDRRTQGTATTRHLQMHVLCLRNALLDSALEFTMRNDSQHSPTLGLMSHLVRARKCGLWCAGLGSGAAQCRLGAGQQEWQTV